MSSTNKTAELQLSQFVGTDIPSILTDYNGDMRKIDAGVLEVKEATASAVSDLSSVTARVTNAESNISGLNSAVNGLATRVTSVEGDVDNIEEIIPASASTSNMLATISDIGNAHGRLLGVYTGATATALQAFQSDLNNLEAINTHKVVLYLEQTGNYDATLYQLNGHFFYPDEGASAISPDKVHEWKCFPTFNNVSSGQYTTPDAIFYGTISNLKDTVRAEKVTFAGVYSTVLATEITLRAYIL